MSNPISNLGTIPTLTVGGRTFTDLTNLKILVGDVSTTNKTTMRVPGATSGYAVTSGKTFVVDVIEFVNPNTTVSYIQLTYADNDVGVNQTTALTNPVYALSNSSSYYTSATVAGSHNIFYPNFRVPAGKYITIVGNVNGSYADTIIYGHEE